jgi:Secretion system C-terminal sorting domain/Dockerin type I domain
LYQNYCIMNITTHLKKYLWIPMCVGAAFRVQAQTANPNNKNLLVNSRWNYAQPASSVQTLQQPSHGLLQTQINNHQLDLSYTPSLDFIGQDAFQIVVDNGSNDTLTFNLNVTKGTVIAKDDYVLTAENQEVTINVLQNDLSLANAPTLNALPLVNFGTAHIENNQIRFVPKVGFTGMAHVQYSACNELNECATGQLHVRVAPETLPSSTVSNVFTTNGRKIMILLPATDFTVQTPPTSGTLQQIQAGIFEYEPTANFTGIDPMTFQQSANGVTKIHIVQAEVLTAHTPRALRDDYAYTSGSRPVTIPVLQNDANGATTLTSISDITGGTATINAAQNAVIFMPDASFTGASGFKYAVNGSTEIGTARVLISDFAPIAPVFRLKAAAGVPLVLNYKVPIQNYSFRIVNAASQGTVQYFDNFNGQLAGQSVQGDHLLIYTPNLNAQSDNFTVEYCVDGVCRMIQIDMDIDPNNNTSCAGDCVWAGDANADGIVDMADIWTIARAMGEKGTVRNQNNQGWQPQSATNWKQSGSNGNNLKHADTNGDGIITAADTIAVNHFWGQKRAIVAQNEGFSVDNLELTAIPAQRELHPGDTLLVYLTVPNTALDVSGYQFALGFNASWLNPASIKVEFGNQWMDENNAALGFYRISNQQIEVGLGLAAARAASGYGTVGILKGIVEEDVACCSKTSRYKVELNFKNAWLQTESGVRLKLKTNNVTIPIIEKPKPYLIDNQLAVFPNPATDALHVYLDDETTFISEMTVFNLTGQAVIQQQDLKTRHMDLKTNELQAGMYVLRAKTTNGYLTKKINISK